MQFYYHPSCPFSLDMLRILTTYAERLSEGDLEMIDMGDPANKRKYPSIVGVPTLQMGDAMFRGDFAFAKLASLSSGEKRGAEVAPDVPPPVESGASSGESVGVGEIHPSLDEIFETDVIMPRK